MEINVVTSDSKKSSFVVSGLKATSTVLDLKNEISKVKRHLYPDRQGLKVDPKGKSLNDAQSLDSIGIKSGSSVYLKDLGPQIGWRTVFLCEYFGPLALYLWSYTRPAILYGSGAAAKPMDQVVHTAAACWAFHYGKRLFETVFIHRFSHGTMPIMNLAKNCSYYWLFGLFIGYHVNHPLYTPPSFGPTQIYSGLALFIFAELGNLSIHVALRNLRPPGTKERRIPKPTGNPFTWLFSLVSCPNYTYEVLAWLGFSWMTQTLPALLFTFVGFYQMTVWALGKHRNYKREFKDYPRNRKSIVPFII